jgi:hypothetical protein
MPAFTASVLKNFSQTRIHIEFWMANETHDENYE